MTTNTSARENNTPPVCAVLMPHAPVLIPDVVGDRGAAAQASGRAMRAAAARVLSSRPEMLALISPHSPRRPGAFGVWAGERLGGSFAQFNAPGVPVSLPNDAPFACQIVTEAGKRGLATWMIRDQSLDHGALVPLWFLAQAGWTGPTVILSLTDRANSGLNALGEAIAAAARASGRRLAIVASGDMSHRLALNAPCGFHPQAHEFDQTFIRLIRDGDYHGIETIAQDLRELAAEDAVDSTLIAAAAVDWKTAGREVLNYEAPFGVGYGVAVLFTEQPTPGKEPEKSVREIANDKFSIFNSQSPSNGLHPLPPLHPRAEKGVPGISPASPGNPPPPPSQDARREGAILPALARQSVEAAFSGSSDPAPAAIGQYLSAQCGIFVTLRERDGTLRGCVGTLSPACPNLVAETWRSARLAALHDSRFPPVQADELTNLRFDVSVLHSMEKISSAGELDPARYGVVVSTEDGRRALLLPGIAEIKTSEQQLSCARKKGSIGAREPVTLQRFQVDHYEEAG